MSEKIFHWTNSFKMLGEDDDGGLDIKGSASTNAVDRAGDIIEHDAWTKGGLENFKSNPIILFNHNYDRPIGRAKELSVGEKALLTQKFLNKMEKLSSSSKIYIRHKRYLLNEYIPVKS